ncbi:unnamed protein product [Bursaphelenchus okinawaensis]|uniref:Uncharacterized protein n=1 Tax=Bursaphelenchus okinawaensis TaxID=465554 RepID=A0A811KJG4_9BILA|nr:unnamed protein product [Bursaphelenchus okinawaensis]CAG9104174.1 unnamed protein product [Bursaphelenchus okinawaensis]
MTSSRPFALILFFTMLIVIVSGADENSTFKERENYRMFILLCGNGAILLLVGVLTLSSFAFQILYPKLSRYVRKHGGDKTTIDNTNIDCRLPGCMGPRIRPI